MLPVSTAALFIAGGLLLLISALQMLANSKDHPSAALGETWGM